MEQVSSNQTLPVWYIIIIFFLSLGWATCSATSTRCCLGYAKALRDTEKIAIPLKPMYAGNVFTHSTLALIYLCIIRRSLLLVVSKRMRLGNM